MSNTELLLAISAGVTLLLAIAAFLAIWQNHQLQKRERKERLLNEIIEWATNIAHGIVTRVTPLSDAHRLFEYAAFYSNSEYIVTIAKGKISENGLVPYVERIRECLRYGIWITGKSIEIEDAWFFTEFPWLKVEQQQPVPKELQTAGIKVLPELDELLRTSAIVLMKKAAESKLKI